MPIRWGRYCGSSRGMNTMWLGAAYKSCASIAANSFGPMLVQSMQKTFQSTYKDWRGPDANQVGRVMIHSK
jgi:uncharacterized protein YqkB